MAAKAKSNYPEHAPAYGKLEPMRETDPFCILEVLTQVLELAGPGAKATAARVCRRWSDPALDMLWRDLTDVTPFLSLLALLKGIDNSNMSPAEMLERIKSYGARVRTLRCTANNAAIRFRGAGKVYYALGRRELQTYLPMVSIPSSGLFPNIRILEWKAEQASPHVERTLEAVSYFLCPSLTHIYVLGIVQLKDHQGDMHEFYPGPPVDCDPFFRALNGLDGLRMESLELRLRKYPEDLTKDHEVGLFLRRHQETLRHFRAWDAGVVTHFQKELWGLSHLRSLEVLTTNELQASGFIEGLAEGAPRNGVSAPEGRCAPAIPRLEGTLERLETAEKAHQTSPGGSTNRCVGSRRCEEHEGGLARSVTLVHHADKAWRPNQGALSRLCQRHYPPLLTVTYTTWPLLWSQHTFIEALYYSRSA